MYFFESRFWKNEIILWDLDNGRPASAITEREFDWREKPPEVVLLPISAEEVKNAENIMGNMYIENPYTQFMLSTEKLMEEIHSVVFEGWVETSIGNTCLCKS